MKKISYICDACKKTKNMALDLNNIEIIARAMKIKGEYYGTYNVDICNECLENHSFIIDGLEVKLGDVLEGLKKTLGR